MTLRNGKFLLDFETVAFYDNKIWFTDWNCNELYFYDLNTKNVELFVKLENEETYSDRLFGAMIIRNNYIYLFPFKGKNIYKVNISTRSIITIELIQINGILSAHLYQNQIVMVGCKFPCFYILDCETDELTSYFQWHNMLNGVSETEDNAYFRKTILMDTKVYAPFTKGNAVIVFDIIEKTFEVHIVGKAGNSYSSICFDGENFWISPRKKNNIIMWNKDTGCQMEYKINSVDVGNYGFGDIVLINRKVYLLPYGGKNIVVLDLDTKNIKKANKEDINGVCQCKANDKIFLFCSYRHTLYTYSLKEDSYEADIIAIDVENAAYHLPKMSFMRETLCDLQRQGSAMLVEEYRTALLDFFNLMDKESQSAKEQNEKTGERIHRIVTL